MSSYGYTNRNDPPDRVVPATRTLNEEPGSRVKAPRSAQERRIPGSLTPEDFDDLDQIAETIITPERVTTPEVLAGIVTGLEGQFESLSALSANMGELVAGVARDEDDRFRLDFDEAVATVRDEADTVRMVWGRLGDGVEDYGLVVYSANGDLILGANGLGNNVVGRDQIGANAVGRAQIEDGEIIRAKIGDAAIGRAQIQNGEIIRAKIGLLAVDDARIENLAVDKLLAGSLGVGRFIESTNFSAGDSGWRLSHTVAEFNDVIIRGTLEGADGTFSGNITSEATVAAETFSASQAIFQGPDGIRLQSGVLLSDRNVRLNHQRIALRDDLGGGGSFSSVLNFDGGLVNPPGEPRRGEYFIKAEGFNAVIGGTAPRADLDISATGHLTLEAELMETVVGGDISFLSSGGGDFSVSADDVEISGGTIILDTLDPISLPNTFVEPSAGGVQGYLPITVGGITYHIELREQGI